MNNSIRSIRSWQIAKSLIRLESGDLTGTEAVELDRMLTEDERFREEFLQMNHGMARVEGLADDPDILAMMDEEAGVPTTQERKRRGPYFVLATMVLAGVLTVVGTSGWFAEDDGFSITRYVTRTGEQKAVELEDGSVISLNTGTQILMDEGEDSRRVTLERGEAYFDVAEDVTRPFSVEVGDHEITVFGTEFNVVSSPDLFQLCVFEGLVAIHGSGEPVLQAAPLVSNNLQTMDVNGQYRVTPGWMITVDRGAGVMSACQPADLQQVVQWRTGMLRFEGATLTEVVTELNRYNPRKILIQDASIVEIPIYGSVKIDNLNSALKSIERSYPIRVTYHVDQIVLTKKKK